MQRDDATLRPKGGNYAVGATQAEIREGRICVGLYNGKAEMPEGVAGEQFSEACCGSKVEDSARVVELLAKKGAEGVYKLFQADLHKTVNGLCSDGWTEESVMKVVNEHQTAFNAKGIQVKFHQYTWEGRGSNQESGTIKKQFMTYADTDVVRDFKPNVGPRPGAPVHVFIAPN